MTATKSKKYNLEKFKIFLGDTPKISIADYRSIKKAIESVLEGEYDPEEHDRVLELLKENARFLGEGVSRVAWLFRLKRGPARVLKILLDSMDIEQAQSEIKILETFRDHPMVPQLFNYHPDFLWAEVEPLVHTPGMPDLFFVDKFINEVAQDLESSESFSRYYAELEWSRDDHWGTDKFGNWKLMDLAF